MKVFVSYSHADGDWVWSRLVTSLKASGVEVLIDRDRFQPGGGVYRQMDATQDQADRHVLVLSATYAVSVPCQHEMIRAIATDPGFHHHKVLPIRRDGTPIPAALSGADPMLYSDLRLDPDIQTADTWDKLLGQCGTLLGAPVPHFLAVRDDIAGLLLENHSVNLVVDRGIRWHGLIDDLVGRPDLRLGLLDLFKGGAETRHGFVNSALEQLGAAAVPRQNHLAHFSRVLGTLGQRRLALQNFDIVAQRPEYDVDLFAALLYEVRQVRTIVLLLQSHVPVANLAPSGHQWSIDLGLYTVNLQTRP